MRIITWNMGCAFEKKYHAAHGDAWKKVEALDPDVALLQEVLSVPEWVDPNQVVLEPRNMGGTFSTLVYVRRGSCARVALNPLLVPMLGGQVVTVEVTDVSGSSAIFASVHARTGQPREPELSSFHALSSAKKVDLRLPEDPGSWNAAIILDAVSSVAQGRRFAVGGDFNLAWRFDETEGGRYWASAQFKAIRDRGWRRPHLKFHAGEERTLFRRSHELFQLDHFFTDEHTYGAAVRCDVIHLEDLLRLSDHAPLLLEIDSGPVE